MGREAVRSAAFRRIIRGGFGFGRNHVLRSVLRQVLKKQSVVGRARIVERNSFRSSCFRHERNEFRSTMNNPG